MSGDPSCSEGKVVGLAPQGLRYTPAMPGGPMARLRRIPEGLRVMPDGSWRVGEEPVRHEASLRYFKAHLSFEDGPAIVAGGRRVPVAMEGPPFEVTRLFFDKKSGAWR